LIIGVAYARAEDFQVDLWQELGNEGWNWTTMLPYYMKSERFQIPKDFQVANGITYNPSVHDTSGPLKVGYVNGMINGTIGTAYNETLTNVGVAWDNDMNSGKMHGLVSPPETIDQEANIREDVARASCWPIANGPNLALFQDTYANKFVWKSTAGCDSLQAA
jgi:choline dehydrogenase-like flavoprotein